MIEKLQIDNSNLIPNLESVAKAANVSTSTASRALNNNSQISLKTRIRVKQIAEHLGYTKNPYISTLMSHVRRTRPAPYHATIAWIDRLPSHSWRDNPVQAQFFEGAVKRSQQLGYHIERISCTDPSVSPSRLTDILKARGISGILCSADRPTPRHMALPFDLDSFAVVTVGCRFTQPALHFSINDQFLSAQRAHRKLRELGYNRIGFVTTRKLESIVDHRFSGGFLSTSPSCSASTDVPIFYADETNSDDFARWLKSYRPDAVLTTYMSEYMEEIKMAGWKVPEEIAFAVLDWDPTKQNIAGIRQNHSRVGSCAIDLLSNQISTSEFGPPTKTVGVTIQGDWIDGLTAPARH